MLLQVKGTEDGLVARRADRGFDRAGAAQGQELQPLLAALAAGTGDRPLPSDGWTVGELLDGIRRVGIVPPDQGFPLASVGWLTVLPLFEERTLIWLDSGRRLLAIQDAPDSPGVLAFDAGRRRLTHHPDLRLDLSQRSLKLRGAHTSHEPGDGFWRLDDAGFMHLTAWDPDRAQVELRTAGERVELVAVDAERWRPARAPRVTLPTLGWPPGIALQTRASLRWDSGSAPVTVGPTGLSARSLILPDPVPEELTWAVEIDLVEPPTGVVSRTLTVQVTRPVATAFDGLMVEADGRETDVVSPGARLGGLVLTGQGPCPRTLALRVTVPDPRGAGPVREVRASWEGAEPGGRALYECPGLESLLQTRGEPVEVRLTSPGQDELGSLVVLPPHVSGRWHPTGPRAQEWRAEGAKLPSRLVRPAVGADGGTDWLPVAEASQESGIVRSRHDLRIGGQRRAHQLRLRWAEAPRLRRLDPWRPIRIAGGDDYVEVAFLAPWNDGGDLRIWLPPIRPAQVPSEDARAGQLRVKLPRGVAGSLDQDCARLEILGSPDEPGPWGWIHRTIDPGPGPWRDVRYDADVALIPPGAELFVDLLGLCSSARLAEATTRRREPAAVLRLQTPWPVDGLPPLGVDGAMLAPVQAATDTSPDARLSHIWLQDVSTDPIHLVLEQRDGGWTLADFEGPEAEREQLGCLGSGGGGLRWLPHQVLGFEQPDTCLVWRGRLLLISPPERPRVRFAGWIWRAGETVHEDGGPLGRFGLRLDRGAGSSRTWEGVEDGGFSWHDPPPAEILSAPALARAEERGLDPSSPLVFEVEVDGAPRSFTLIAKKSGSAFDPMRLTLVEGTVATEIGAGPLRVWQRESAPEPKGGDR